MGSTEKTAGQWMAENALLHGKVPERVQPGDPRLGEAWIGVEGLVPCKGDNPIKAMGMGEAKDRPADPWPKCEPIRIDYDAMEVVPAEHFDEARIENGKRVYGAPQKLKALPELAVGVDLADDKHSDWTVESEWELKDGVVQLKSMEARPAPKTFWIKDGRGTRHATAKELRDEVARLDELAAAVEGMNLAVPVPKTLFIADAAEGFDPSLDVTAFANRHIPIGSPWGTDAMAVLKGRIQSALPPEEPVAAPVIVEG